MKVNLTKEQWQELVMDALIQVVEMDGSDTVRASAAFDECPIVEPKEFNRVLIELKRAGRITGKTIKNENGNVIDLFITINHPSNVNV